MIVYCIRNRANGKVYIGKTIKSLRHRWTQHQIDARRKAQLPLHRAIRKYGANGFSVTVLKTCVSLEELNQEEKKFILSWKSHVSLGGYNATWGGDGTEPGEKSPAFGTHRTPEIRLLLSECKKGDKNPSHAAMGEKHWNRGLIRSEETRAKIREKRILQVTTFKGMHHTEETKAKIRLARANQAPPSPEARRKMGNAWRGKHRSEETIQRMREGWKLRKIRNKTQCS
jgi:group I intron endonuclease